MTVTKPESRDRASSASARGTRSSIWMIAAVVLVAAGILAAILLWPDDEEPLVLSDAPPFGLTEIDMPRGGDVVAVLERLPAIDGRQPTTTTYGELITVVYEGAQLPEGYWSIWVMLDVEVEAEWFVDGLRQEIADADDDGRIIEASALDPSGDLVWLAASGTEEGLSAFSMTWADPSDLGPAYTVWADSADLRRKLVHAFITVVGQ